ncbi:MAG: M14 family metallocarboxypeptidase [Opitutales bacterium]
MSDRVNSAATTPPPPDVGQLLADFLSQATAQGFRTEVFGQIEAYPLLALTKRAPGPRPRIYLSAGIHGDEPAPPQALLALLKDGLFDGRATWFICPVLNPVGLQRGTRENGQRRDLNRDYQDRLSAEVAAHTAWLNRQPPFDLTLCLHEDWEARGFYLYELNPHARPSLAPAMIDSVRSVMPIDIAEVIDGRAVAEPGIIRPVSDPLLRQNWPAAIYLRHHHTTLSYTIETPTSLPLAQRLAALHQAIGAALTLATRD